MMGIEALRSHPLPWPTGLGGTGRWAGLECSAQKALSCQGHAVGPEASPLPSLGLLLPPPTLMGQEDRLWPLQEGRDGAEDKKQRGLSRVEEGFGHDWSAQPLPCLDTVPGQPLPAQPSGARQLPQ